MSAATKGSYVIAGGTAGRERLRVLSGVMADSTLTLIDRVGIPPDARVLDLGCGGGDVTRMLARLAHRGTVLGVDFDPDIVAIAGAETRNDDLSNVEFLVGDVTASDSAIHARIAGVGPFDVIYARFLLSHLADPIAVVRQMIGWCAADGVVVVEDIDHGGSVCAPPHKAFTRASALYTETVRARGGDPQLGLRLPTMLHTAGLRDVEVSIAQPGGLTGDAKRIQLLTLENIAARSIELELTTPDEVAELTRELSRHVERDDTFITTARVVQAWGRARRPIDG